MATHVDAGLAQLASRLLGTWETSSTHVLMPDTPVAGTSRFEWLAGERFLLAWSWMEHPEFPDALVVLGGEPLRGQYFDSRGVHRVFDLSVVGDSLVLERAKDGEEFAQRMTFTVVGDEVRCLAERADDGVTWQPDLEATYRRT